MKDGESSDICVFNSSIFRNLGSFYSLHVSEIYQSKSFRYGHNIWSYDSRSDLPIHTKFDDKYSTWYVSWIHGSPEPFSCKVGNIFVSSRKTTFCLANQCNICDKIFVCVLSNCIEQFWWLLYQENYKMFDWIRFFNVIDFIWFWKFKHIFTFD